MRISTKITLTGTVLVFISMITFLGTLLVQRGPLQHNLEGLVHEQAVSEAAKVVNTMYLNCESVEQRNQRRLTHNLNIARELLQKNGNPSVSSETVQWKAINQFTRQPQSIQLPKLQFGSTWFGQVSATNESVPVVDEVKHFTRDFCTIFQRMNDDGDMLRVSTSVVTTNGTRAIGTFIPRRNPDGSLNPVIDAVLRGETYRGRAFVVNEYHAAAYEPIWDAAHARVVGMLYVGIGMGSINKELEDTIKKLTVGKRGYMFVLNGKGDAKGSYVVTQRGEENSRSAWDSKDASGKPVFQSIIGKALQTTNGTLANEFYSLKGSGDAQAGNRFAVTTYFAPWDWVIVASGYEQDFEPILQHVARSINGVVLWTAVAGVIVSLIGFGVSYCLSRGITRPVMQIVDQLNNGTTQTVVAAEQVAASGKLLAAGASDQAASLEESSASLEEMASMTGRNSEHARKAKELAKEARQAADVGATDMERMNAAMEAIKVSSDDVSKIIKTIDEIAFQTNILALNAAVEAARAGEAGLGFAVVANEVRTLAQRSAQAARETSEKIQQAISRTGQGVDISTKVAQALNEIVTRTRQVDELVSEVATASQEQKQGIAQINQAVSEVDKITQSNAARAQESSAAAHQLNVQAELIFDSISTLSRLVHGNVEPAKADPKKPAASHPKPVEMPELVAG